MAKAKGIQKDYQTMIPAFPLVPDKVPDARQDRIAAVTGHDKTSAKGQQFMAIMQGLIRDMTATKAESAPLQGDPKLGNGESPQDPSEIDEPLAGEIGELQDQNSETREPQDLRTSETAYQPDLPEWSQIADTAPPADDQETDKFLSSKYREDAPLPLTETIRISARSPMEVTEDPTAQSGSLTSKVGTSSAQHLHADLGNGFGDRPADQRDHKIQTSSEILRATDSARQIPGQVVATDKVASAAPIVPQRLERPADVTPIARDAVQPTGGKEVPPWAAQSGAVNPESRAPALPASVNTAAASLQQQSQAAWKDSRALEAQVRPHQHRHMPQMATSIGEGVRQAAILTAEQPAHKSSAAVRGYLATAIPHHVATDQPLPSEGGERLIHGVTAASFPPMASATPTPSTAEQARHVASQIAATVTHSGPGITDLQLSPEELGRVRMTFSGTEGALTVAILADRPETLDLMRRHVDQMAQEFRSMGYDSLRFSFGSQSGAASDQGGAEQPGHAGKTTAQQADTPAESARTLTPLRVGNAGLDMRL